MFAEDFLSISMAEIIGFLITIVSVGLIVRQLTETRLASQMEGILELMNHWSSLTNDRQVLMKLTYENSEWESLSAEAAYDEVFNSQVNYDSFLRVFNFMDTVGLLVREKALEKGLAFGALGMIVPLLYGYFEKIVLLDRARAKTVYIYDNFEWLAQEFEKMSNSNLVDVSPRRSLCLVEDIFLLASQSW